MLLASWFTQHEHGGLPVERAVPAAMWPKVPRATRSMRNGKPKPSRSSLRAAQAHNLRNAPVHRSSSARMAKAKRPYKEFSIF
jgi:hypothetical protein